MCGKRAYQKSVPPELLLYDSHSWCRRAFLCSGGGFSDNAVKLTGLRTRCAEGIVATTLATLPVFLTPTGILLLLAPDNGRAGGVMDPDHAGSS
ncbi:hypothetical protein DL89DRAFT_92167 [Linderina pennispora]|uniref:Uncharacterized protein n=1 Tax=Linderina pennispora TaxID=61395 RepID=A0A1Y1WIM6_9FUNG|nr:uncharacterized protein DL89DRAFT_92167 [Linderina pennispora]ORX73389.1 hypothetical protein DL89DRAFT_92167 [Linderina pennispora]